MLYHHLKNRLASLGQWTRFARSSLFGFASLMGMDSLRSALLWVACAPVGVWDKRITKGGGGIPPLTWAPVGLNMALTMDTTKFKFGAQPLTHKPIEIST